MILLLSYFILHSKRLTDSFFLLHSQLSHNQIIKLMHAFGVTNCQANLAAIRYETFTSDATKSQLLVPESQFCELLCLIKVNQRHVFQILANLRKFTSLSIVI